MENFPFHNTYLSVTLFVWKPGFSIKNSGRIYTSSESAKLDLHLDVDYATAKREMAKLMLRTGKLPSVYGKESHDMVMYTLTAFLD